MSSVGEGFPQRVFCWRKPDCTAPIHEKGAVIFPLVASRGGGGATSSSATRNDDDDDDDDDDGLDDDDQEDD